MKKLSLRQSCLKKLVSAGILLGLFLVLGCSTSGSKTAKYSAAAGTAPQPMTIVEDVSCGKCGMYPANYPRWQSQMIFKDGSMTPFDGCKCMFNFMHSMDKFDKAHSRDDIAVMWVKDFSSGEWLDASSAHYVVGSSMMGPMGKELIPFADKETALKFHQEHGGSMMAYADITSEVLKSLMGGMKMHHDEQQHHMEQGEQHNMKM